MLAGVFVLPMGDQVMHYYQTAGYVDFFGRRALDYESRALQPLGSESFVLAIVPS